MKEHPILFSTDMVQAILEGRKTQTRRPVKLPEHLTRIPFYANGSVPPEKKPYLTFIGGRITHVFKGLLRDEEERVAYPPWRVGDRIYVRETCWILGKWVKNGRTNTGKQKWMFCPDYRRCAKFDASHPNTATKTTPRESLAFWKRPSIHVPKWASRIMLEVTAVRAERIQDITREDVIAEGVKLSCDSPCSVIEKYGHCVDFEKTNCAKKFITLWDSIYDPRGLGWDVNQLVWATTFKKLEGL